MKLDVLLFLFTLLSLVTGDVDSLSNIAVFVLGEHRLYDGTWPSHHRHLYRPIRHHKLTKRFDVFVCQKDGEILPANMPKPTAEFHAPKKFDQKESWSECFGMLLEWLCHSESDSECNTLTIPEIGYNIFKSRYDWIIRTRPDIEMVYDIPWPPIITGDVMSQINEGQIGSYSWFDSNLKLNMFTASFRKIIIEHHGCPPIKIETHKAHNPCVDIADQVAMIRSNIAHVYFGYPNSKYLSFKYLNRKTSYHSLLNPKLKYSKEYENISQTCKYYTASSKPMENVLNNRLRREGINIGPIEFPYILPGARKQGTFPSCTDSRIYTKLEECLKTRDDIRLVVHEKEGVMMNRDMKVRCLPGERVANLTGTN